MFGATNASAQSTVELPYSITFDSTNDVWTVLDASPSPGTSWVFNNDWGNDGFCIGNAWTATPSYCIRTDSGEPNDYYVSPSFSLKAGKTYTVKTSSGTMYSTPATLSVEYTTTPTNAASFTKLSDISMPSSGAQYDNSYDLTVPEDGLYSFAFHATNTSAGDKSSWVYLYALGFSIEEKVGGETPDPGTDPDQPDPPVVDQDGTLPYDMTFDSAEKFATWTTMDNSDIPGVTWAYTASDFAGKPAAHMGPDATSGTCDWLVSPKFELKEGKSYKITVDAASGPNSDKTGANAYGYIFDFSLAEKKAVVEEPVATEPVVNLAAAELTAEKSVELTWTNPTKDVDGKDLPADALLTVKVYEGEELLATQDTQAPGSKGTYTKEYTADTFAGEHAYKVVVVYKDKESEAATATLTVVVDAINGVVVPTDAKVSVHTLGGAAVGNNLSTLGKGTYIVTMKRADGTMKTVKVTK